MQVKGNTFIPNFITLGNAVCGFVALTLIAGVQVVDGEVVNLERLNRAAWCIMLGMVFDVFDGRVARMTGGTSSLGAQLDSFSDLVTFGLAPAGLVVTLSQVAFPFPAWTKIAWIFGLAYFLGAMLRLARFNVEHDEAEDAHQCFKGMPTPAAAGVVSTLVIVYFWLGTWQSWELRAFASMPPDSVLVLRDRILLGLPFLAFILGYAMVSSRLNYPHVASQIFGRKHSFDFFAFIIFGAILTAFMMEPILCLAFLIYLLCPLFSVFSSGPKAPAGPEPGPGAPGLETKSTESRFRVRGDDV